MLDPDRPEEIMTAFARTRIRQTLGQGDIRDDTRGDSRSFPKDLWTAMGEAGLLDPDIASLPGTPCQTLTRLARILAEEGGSLGLPLSWIIHHLTAAFITGPAGAAARGLDLAPSLKTGAATLSFAVSEPDVGGHPKFISTRAEQDGAGWILNGEKSYLTNGPIARAFVVIAVTGQTRDDQGREKKEFSAFLVDRDAPGLEVLPPMEIPFFRPSPHCGIRLRDCRVGPEALVGTEGRAYPDLVLRFRAWEDALMTGAVSGAMAALVRPAALACPNAPEDKSRLEALGRLTAMADAAGALSDCVAGDVDGAAGREGLHLYFRELASGFVRAVTGFLEVNSLTLSHPGAGMLKDLEASATLGKTVARIRLQKLGRRAASGAVDLPPG